jgi:hypothetical protein
MIATPNAILKLAGQSVWRGQDKTNGVLMIGDHVPRITTSFSRLVLSPALTALGLEGVPFGSVVWYDDNQKTADPATVYAGMPTGPGAVPVLAGIIPAEQGVASGFPTNDSGTHGHVMLPHMKMRLVKCGFLWYKYGLAEDGTEIDYAGITRGMSLFAQNTTGLPIFAEGTRGITLPDLSGVSSVGDLVTALSQVFVPGSAEPELADATFIGRVIHLEPENESALVAFGF